MQKGKRRRYIANMRAKAEQKAAKQKGDEMVSV